MLEPNATPPVRHPSYPSWSLDGQLNVATGVLALEALSSEPSEPRSRDWIRPTAVKLPVLSLKFCWQTPAVKGNCTYPEIGL